MDVCEECSKNSTKMDENYQNQRQYEGSGERRSRTFNIRKSSIYVLLLVFITSSLIPSLTLASTICTHHEYWDSAVDNCVPCTRCSKHQIIIRPCQKHLDTVCKALNSVEIDWSKSIVMATEKGELKKDLLLSTVETISQTSHQQQQSIREEEEMLLWDWQMISLVLAIIACLLFFTVTAIISINYVRQWRKIKKQFDTDIEQLSQQLMAKLAVPPVESSTIFIDDPSTRRNALGPRQIEVRCVYLEDIIAGKESLKDSITITNGTAGNVYIDDKDKRHHIITAGQKIV